MGSGIFDIIGPVMVGPSSSHTAGAARIAAIANQVCGSIPAKVDFYLHGSFAETYKGHGTDQALVGGILGLDPDNRCLVHAVEIAQDAGIEFNFHPIDLGDVHPNTVKIVMQTADGVVHEVIGSSIGGGGIIIHSVNTISLEFSADNPTIITLHEDKPGLLASVTNLLASYEINIAFLKVIRQVRGIEASMVIETDDDIPATLIEDLKHLKGIKNAQYINLIREEMRGHNNVPIQ